MSLNLLLIRNFMRQFLIFFCCFCHLITWCQSDLCTNATQLIINSTCQPYLASTFTTSTNLPGCVGNSDDDVWFKFTANTTSIQIQVNPSNNLDPVIQLFQGNCNNLSSMVCRDLGSTSQTEQISQSGLIIGNTYYIRVYHYGSGSGSGNFDICLTNPVIPANNLCGNAISLNINSLCNSTSGTTLGATQSMNPCSGYSEDDVWYKFTANNSSINLLVTPTNIMDPVVQIYSGNCTNLTTVNCSDIGGIQQSENLNLVGLVNGQTYFIRVYDYYVGNPGNFEICLSQTTGGTVINDDPCGAILLPEVSSACNYLEFNTTNCTASISAPTPNTCIGGSSPQIGGFSTLTRDIWFKIIVPSTGQIHVTSEPNMGIGYVTDGVMALYSGTCSNLNQITCSDDYVNYPGISNDLLPMINASGLTPGSTVYLRYFGYGSTFGKFGFCVSSSINDLCQNALYICDLNGYSGSTSPALTPDRPGNMRGNNEDLNGQNMPDGINTGGIFGQSGPWGTGSANFDVTINNNSWIRFTADSTTATLGVSISNCWIGNYPQGGIQMQIFQGNNCQDFVPVSDFKEGSTSFNLTANNLIPGEDYYLMVDGLGGDICSYTITANSGVLFPNIPDQMPICQGDSLTITAPNGADSYLWTHNGSNQQSITISPAISETYSCEITGICGQKQLLETFITVKANPEINISVIDSSNFCIGENISLQATGASSYIWSTNETNDLIIYELISETILYVTGTIDGCSSSDSLLITPIIPLASTINTNSNDNVFCEGQTIELNSTGLIYNTWTGPNQFNSNNSNVSFSNAIDSLSGWYFISGADNNYCVISDSLHISIENIEFNFLNTHDTTICEGQTFYLTENNFTNGYWNGPNYFSGNNTILISNCTSINAGWYIFQTVNSECQSSDSLLLKIKPLEECLSIPNLVSPNNDGHNDNWIIEGLNANLTTHLFIFNRWGNLIFEENPFENSWNGHSNKGLDFISKDQAVPSGTYYYILEIEKNNPLLIKGFIDVQY